MRITHPGNNHVHSAEAGATRHPRKAGASKGAHAAHHPAPAAPETHGEGVHKAAHGVHASISSKAREASRAREIARAAPDIREERIAELKKRIAQGGYHVDADAIADRLVNEHLRSRIR